MNIQSLLQIDFLLLVVTIGRLKSIVTGLLAITSVIIGRQALSRATKRTAPARPKAIAALVIAGISIVLSVLHLTLTTGGFGTGSGKLGAIVALALGLTGAGFSGLALARSGSISGENSQPVK
jgi:hypothetical protein